MPRRWCWQSVQEEAKKHDSVTAFKSCSRGAFKWAKRNDMLKEVTAHMPPKGSRRKYTREYVAELASGFTIYKDFVAAHPTAVSKAFEHGYYDVLDHLERGRQRKGYWADKQNVIDEALKYNTRADWDRGHRMSYNAAWKGGWLDDPEVTGHMKRLNGHDNDAVYCWVVTSAANDDVVAAMPGYNLCKVGVTSAKLGDDRPKSCSRDNGMGMELVGIMRTPIGKARNYEGLMLSRGTDAGVPDHYDGYTEFRIFSDSELDDMRQLLCA